MIAIVYGNNMYHGKRIMRLRLNDEAYSDSDLSLIFLSGNKPASGAILGMIMPNLITAAGLFPDRKIRERSLALLILRELYEE